MGSNKPYPNLESFICIAKGVVSRCSVAYDAAKTYGNRALARDAGEGDRSRVIGFAPSPLTSTIRPFSMSTSIAQKAGHTRQNECLVPIRSCMPLV